MNNKAAFALAILIIGAFAADKYYFEWDLPLLLGKKLAELTEYLAIWR